MERGVHNDRMRTHLHGLLAVALGKRIKLLTLPYIHLPPTITPIEPESLGEAALIFTTHLHPPATTIPTGNIISLHILCIQHSGVGECAEMCGCGQTQISFPCIYGGDKPVVKRILKIKKRYDTSGVQHEWYLVCFARQKTKYLFRTTLCQH